ncbi:MAG: hypothetical protein GX916_06880 [Clostridiales bacterium]|nr:hypothetical protein [Clostridiales bacterium]
MTSRERLLAALKLQPTDRVPINTYELCPHNSQSFENKEPSYRDLMSFIRANCDSLTMWNPSGNGVFALSSHPAEIRHTQDTVPDKGLTINRYSVTAPSGRVLTWTDQVYQDVVTTWHTEHICKTLQDVDDFLSFPYTPITYDASDYVRIREELGDHGLIMASVGDPLCTAMEIMEFGEATVWAMTETDHFESAIKEIHRRNMINLENMLKAQVVDLYRICGPEYATPPYLPPRFFERFVVPCVTDMTRLIHRYGGLVRIHSHGRVGQVLDMILTCGADGIDPCEAPPDGDISLGELKRRVAGRLCVFGNLQLKLLERASENEVRSTVKQCMEEAKEGYGYVIMPTASPINIPLAQKTENNYRVFIEAALEYGVY